MSEFEDKLRAAFDAELKQAPAPPNLRHRVISNAVATPRRRSGWAAWLSGPRLAAVGAVAAVLVVAGVGIRLATQTSPPVAQHRTTPSAAPVLAFGKIPAPQFHPPQGLGGGGGNSGQQVLPYFGPAAMTWSGTLPRVPSSAPVYRFALPSQADVNAFAARLHGVPDTSPNALPASYRLPNGYELSVQADPVAQEYVFIINSTKSATGSQPINDAGATAAASAGLAHFGLTPSWPFAITVTPLSPPGGPLAYIVQYQRIIDLPGGATAGEVDGNGDPSGIQVTVDASGAPIRIAGPLRLAETSAAYPLRTGSDGVKAALAAAPLAPSSGPVPQVALTKASLVYVVTESDNVGYMEPAYLFTGRFTQNGETMEKRVIVPAVVPSAVSP